MCFVLVLHSYQCCVYNLHVLFSSADGHLEIFPFLILVNNAILTLLYIFFSFEHIYLGVEFLGSVVQLIREGEGKREGRREDAHMCMHIDAHILVQMNTLLCNLFFFLFLLEQNEMDIFLLANMFFFVAIFSSFSPIVLHPGVSIFVSKFTNCSPPLVYFLLLFPNLNGLQFENSLFLKKKII